MRNVIFPIVLSMLLLNSCMITNTPGFYSGYKKLNKESKDKIEFLDSDQVIALNSTKIEAINADIFLNSIRDNDTSIVYFWDANCSSDECVPISYFQKIASDKGYSMFIIGGYYDEELFKIKTQYKIPILTVNHFYYKTDYCPSYSRKFRNEIDRNDILDKTNSYHRFYFFKGNRLVKTMRKIN